MAWLGPSDTPYNTVRYLPLGSPWPGPKRSFARSQHGSMLVLGPVHRRSQHWLGPGNTNGAVGWVLGGGIPGTNPPSYPVSLGPSHPTLRHPSPRARLALGGGCGMRTGLA